MRRSVDISHIDSDRKGLLAVVSGREELALGRQEGLICIFYCGCI
jgi:hypothetical protein